MKPAAVQGTEHQPRIMDMGTDQVKGTDVFARYPVAGDVLTADQDNPR